MIEVVPSKGVVGHDLPLGEIAVFEIRRLQPDVEIRWFLHFRNIMQIRALSDWSAELRELEMLPESPGPYDLTVEWRRGPEQGWVSYRFLAKPDHFAPKPTRVSRGRWGKFWVPSEFESKGVAQYEPDLFKRLGEWVKPGQVVFDVGANIGLFTVPFSRRVGAQGQVIGFEPNPICLHFLSLNLQLNQCDNARVLPVALTDEPRDLPFTVNLGNSFLGLSSASGFFHQKAGMDISVPGRALDDMMGYFRLPVPDVIKIDVEGAEGPAIRGMRQVLESHRPLLLLEIHGANAMSEVAPVLDPLGYVYDEVESDRRFHTSGELAQDLIAGPVVRQLACFVP